MQTRPIILIASALLANGCKDIACGSGTIEKNGSCVPADETVGTATCGPFTSLQGDKCVPMFTPTDCDTATTTPVLDPTTGVTTCVGNGGGGGCSGAFACAASTDAGKQTICGQIYDLETDMPFQAQNPTGAKCTGTETTGPCALGIQAFDAVTFATQGPASTPPLAIGSIYIDDCGRYRATDITTPGGPYIALGFDDRVTANAGPAGITNTTGVATGTLQKSATANFDAFVVTKAATDMWAANSTSMPTVAEGMVVNIYKSHETGEGDQAGVTFCRTSGSSCNPAPNDDFYFTASDTGRHTIDPTATVTGVNGTAIVLNAHIQDGAINSGSGGLDSTGCIWQLHPASSTAGVVFVQVKRPMDDFMGDTCTRN